MPKETMTSRERWLAVLRREKPDRVPMDIWITPEAKQNLLSHLGCDWDEMARRLHLDLPFNVGGRYVGPPPKPGQNIWGQTHKTVDHGTGAYDEVTNAPLAAFDSVGEIEAHYVWPKADHWRYDHIPKEVLGQEHRPIRGGGSEPFLLYKQLRGEEQAFMDLVEHADIVEYVMGKLFDLAYENTRRIFEAIPGKVMISYVAEDLGGQDALMYSPRHIRRFFLPGMKRMAELVRQNGSFVFNHTDGSVRNILEDLITVVGIQVLNPIQWRCPGMEREGLKRDFGSRLIFHGAIDNQQTLPFGTPADVKQEVADCLRILGGPSGPNGTGPRGGYILAPCHNIQSVTPPQNILAMYEAGYELGWM